jgi:hypothetical protein
VRDELNLGAAESGDHSTSDEFIKRLENRLRSTRRSGTRNRVRQSQPCIGMQRARLVESSSLASSLLCRHPRDHHPYHFWIKPTNAIAANDEVRWIKDVVLNEIQHRPIHLGPFRLH